MSKKDKKLIRRVHAHHLALTGERLAAGCIVLTTLPSMGTLFQAHRTPNLDPVDSALALASYVVCDDCDGIDPCDVAVTGPRQVMIRLKSSGHRLH